MFNFFSRKNKKLISNKELTSLSFNDLVAHNIWIEIKQNGNDNILVISEEKSKCEIILDKELCLILSTIFNEYGKEGTMNNILSVITKDKKEDK